MHNPQLVGYMPKCAAVYPSLVTPLVALPLVSEVLLGSIEYERPSLYKSF